MKFTDLDTFTRAYIVTALWSSNDEDGNPLDRDHSHTDLHPEAIARMAEDCRKFQEDNADTLTDAIATGDVVCGPDFEEYGRAGHDFWLTRNGHGCGFWDGDWPEPYAQALTDAAEAFGGSDLYIGDDGQIYLS